MKKEFIENMVKARRYEMKAMYSLLPVSVREELEGGVRELFKTAVKYGMEILQEESRAGTGEEKKVRKVSID